MLPMFSQMTSWKQYGQSFLDALPKCPVEIV
jgi:hypothetical protein